MNMIQRERASTIFTYVILTVGVLFWLYPLVFMILGSLKPNDQINTQFLPTEITLDHYRLILAGGTGFERPFFLSIVNSFIVSAIDTLAIVLTSALAAYALARLEFPGRRQAYNFILFQMLFPGILFLIPTFLLVSNLSLVGTRGGMIIRFVTDATSVFLYYQFFRTIPQDLLDAARVDGANEVITLQRVVLPLATSTTAFIIMFRFMERWSEFLWDLIVSAGNSQVMTLSVLLGSFVGGGGYDSSEYLGAQMAGATILTVPIIIMFVVFRRYFQEGIATTGLKG